jgi:hypothetical protein
MNVPGFTAEASLYKMKERYQATAEATVYGGIVQPAFSDVFDLDRPIFCFKTVFVNFAPPGYPPKLVPRRVLGFWNPATASCS